MPLNRNRAVSSTLRELSYAKKDTRGSSMKGMPWRAVGARVGIPLPLVCRDTRVWSRSKNDPTSSKFSLQTPQASKEGRYRASDNSSIICWNMLCAVYRHGNPRAPPHAPGPESMTMLYSSAVTAAYGTGNSRKTGENAGGQVVHTPYELVRPSIAAS